MLANTLSLLQGVESFIGREKAVSHNFIHLSMQELLAAWYIATQLPTSEQVSKFNELIHKSRFSAVFRFYAAITKLKTPGIEEVVIKIAKVKNESLFLCLLHCLYEAQDPSLCELVARQLRGGLYLYGTTLSLSDCCCIGYFLAHVCKMAVDEFRVGLDSCSIGDQGCQNLASGLHKCLDTHRAMTTRLLVDMQHNAITHRGLNHLSIFLNIDSIYLNLRSTSEHDVTHAPLGTFAEKLKNNTTLRVLWLQGCGLNSQSAESLTAALTTNKHLEKLYIGDNALHDDGTQHLARALRVNQGLKHLSLVSCGMTDVGAECLAKSLQRNVALNRVLSWNLTSSNQHQNRLTEKIVPILTVCLQNNYTLTELQLPAENLRSSPASIEKPVNDVRKRSGRPLITILSGMSVPLSP